MNEHGLLLSSLTTMKSMPHHTIRIQRPTRMGTEVSIMNEALSEMTLKDRKMTPDGDRNGVYFRWNEQKYKGEKNNTVKK